MNEKIMKRNYPYPSLRGMDLAGDGGFELISNMYVDYMGSGGAIESVVGYRKCTAVSGGIDSFCILGEGEEAILLILSGRRLYTMAVRDRDKRIPLKQIATLEGDENRLMPLGSLCLISDGRRLVAVDHLGEVRTISEDIFASGCRSAAIYRGRLFLSGNPALPHVIFYSSPIREGNISIDNRIYHDCEGNIDSLTVHSGYLWACCSSNDEESGIIQIGEDNGSFSVRRIIEGLAAIYRTIVFEGSLHLLTSRGLVSLKFEEGGNEVMLHCHSSAVNRVLRRERPDNACLGVWMGYLVISFGESVYLADPRGKNDYEWYYLNRIGGNKYDRRVYRYRKSAEDGLLKHPDTDGVAEGEIYSRKDADGRMIYYSVEGDKRYSVYPTPELMGGEFMPARMLQCSCDLMWFSTDDGGLYLFNNDKRGRMPEDIPFADALDLGIESLPPDAIHPLYYSFAGHAPSYIMMSQEEECEEYGRWVSPRTRSLTLMLKRASGGVINIAEIADGELVNESEISMETGENEGKVAERGKDFLSITLPDRTAGARRRQLCIYSNRFASPFGIASISYRKKQMKGKKDE